MRILVFRPGQLGDVLVALPALQAIRSHFKDARIILLSDRQQGKSWVVGKDILDGTGLVDGFESYTVFDKRVTRIRIFLERARLWLKVREGGFDAVVYLAPSLRKPRQVIRDKVFFRSAGIQQLLGFSGFPFPRRPSDSGFLAREPHEAELLLRRITQSGIKEGTATFRLPIPNPRQMRARCWIERQTNAHGKTWIAVCPGSKMPVKIWPEERFAEVVHHLIADFDIWPVVFGSIEEKVLAERLVTVWRRGTIASGQLGIQDGIEVMKRCRLFLGNDTGAMHMAVVAGIQCVSIFSARAPEGSWYPYGQGHVVFRKKVRCEGCMLNRCVKEEMKCILSISVDEVYEGCRALLESQCKAQNECGIH
ncbi:MAG TPA: glycosyltransferase family 9 protein [Terrimicrobiaceae bacterium]